MRKILLVAIALASAAVFAQSARNFERRVAADPKGAVEISNVAGTVVVSTWDRAEVDVKAQLERNVERVDVLSERGRTIVKVVLPRDSEREGDAELQVVIPRGSELSVTAVSADVITKGIAGVQRLQTVSGDIVAEIGPSNIEVRTVSGNATLRGSGRPGELRVNSVSGDIQLDQGAGRVEATTVSGNLRVSAAPVTAMHVRTTSGDLTFNGRLARNASLDAETLSGNLELRAVGEAGYEYEVTTFSGDIENCFNQRVDNSGFGPGSRLSGRHGNGAAKVRIRTMSGDVDLCDR